MAATTYADGSSYDPVTGVITKATIDQSYKPPATPAAYTGDAGYYHPADTSLQTQIANMQKQVYQQSSQPQLAQTVQAPTPPPGNFNTPIVQSPSGQNQSVSGGSDLYQQYAQPGTQPKAYGETLVLPSGQSVSKDDPNYGALAQQMGVLRAGQNYEPGKVSSAHTQIMNPNDPNVMAQYDPNSIIWLGPSSVFGVKQPMATLVGPNGERVAVRVGSAQAQEWFGKGYVLDKGDGVKYNTTGGKDVAVTPGATVLNSPTGGFQNQGTEGQVDTGTTASLPKTSPTDSSSSFQAFLASLGMGPNVDASAFQAPTGTEGAQSQIDAMLAEYKKKLGEGIAPTAEEQAIAEQLASIQSQEEKLTAEPYQQRAAQIQAEQEAITRGELTPVIAGQTNAIARRQALQALTSQAQLASLKAQAVPLQAKLAALQAQRKASTDVAVELYNAQYKSAQDALDNNRQDAAMKLDALNSFLSNQNMQRDDARMVMKDMLSTFGTKAFDGVDAASIRNLETKAGYPSGTISSGLKTLKEAEAKGEKPELREVGGNLYSISFDSNTGKYTTSLLLSKGTTAGTKAGTTGGNLSSEDPLMRLAVQAWMEKNPGELPPSNKTQRDDILSIYFAENKRPEGVQGPARSTGLFSEQNPFVAKPVSGKGNLYTEKNLPASISADIAENLANKPTYAQLVATYPEVSPTTLANMLKASTQ